MSAFQESNNLPLSTKELRDCVGPLRDLPVGVRPLFDPAHFVPLPAPGPQDWLANHPEAGQTFVEFVRSHPNRPDKKRHTLYLQPLDAFPSASALLPSLKKFGEVFFQLPVHILPLLEHTSIRIRSRINSETQKPQLFTRDVLDLLTQSLPTNAFCVLGITLQDLYPDPSWNFVFGEASLNERVGVYSFARYDPRFYGEVSLDHERLILLRSCKVLAHEAGHMFGLDHCVYFRCLMNGSNHMAESDARPLHLCPVDLHKLIDCIGFDPVLRYKNLMQFCRSVGFDEEADWIVTQLERVKSTPVAI